MELFKNAQRVSHDTVSVKLSRSLSELYIIYIYIYRIMLQLFLYVVAYVCACLCVCLLYKSMSVSVRLRLRLRLLSFILTMVSITMIRTHFLCLGDGRAHSDCVRSGRAARWRDAGQRGRRRCRRH